jgi:hypothetical protein
MTPPTGRDPLEKPKEDIFPAHVHSEIKLNDLDAVSFKDPFSEVTRRAKRNLVVASFVAILVAALELKVTGFLGLSASGTDLGNDVAQGLAWMVVIYSLVTFLPHVFVDYAAWKFEHERRHVTPYLSFLEMLESRIRATEEQLKTVAHVLTAEGFKEGDPKLFEIGSQNLASITEQFNRIAAEARPLMKVWAEFVVRTRRLSARLRVRVVSLWAFDIVFPVAFAGCALLATYKGVGALLIRVLS